MKIALIYILLFAFLALLFTPNIVHAGGGGGCGDDSGCNNVMYGIAIGTTLALLIYLYYDYQKSHRMDQTKQSKLEEKESIFIDNQQSENTQLIPGTVVFRW